MQTLHSIKTEKPKKKDVWENLRTSFLNNDIFTNARTYFTPYTTNDNIYFDTFTRQTTTDWRIQYDYNLGELRLPEITPIDWGIFSDVDE